MLKQWLLCTTVWMLSFLPSLITEFSCKTLVFFQEWFPSPKSVQNSRKQEGFICLIVVIVSVIWEFNIKPMRSFLNLISIFLYVQKYDKKRFASSWKLNFVISYMFKSIPLHGLCKRIKKNSIIRVLMVLWSHSCSNCSLWNVGLITI